MNVVLRSATNFLPNVYAITGPAPPRVELMLPSDVLPGRRDEYRSFLPMVDTQLTTLLKGLACSTVVNLENTTSGVRAIRIGNNARFLLDGMAGDTIYERRFYPQLVSAIRGARRRVLLLSNPGTGKSVFQFYLLARYLNPSLFTDAPLSGEIKFGSEVAPKVVVRHLPPFEFQVWFLDQRVVHKFIALNAGFVLQCFDPATTLYFFEPGKTKNIEPYADENLLSFSTLATVSPDKSRYNEFIKIAQRVFMPVFTEEELVAIGRDMKTRPDFNSALEYLYSDKEIRGRFEIFNGIIRHVLPQNQVELQQVRQERDVALENIDAAKVLYGDIESQIISHYVAAYDVAVDESGVYDFSKMGLSLVNQEIKKKLQDRLEKLSLNERARELKRHSETGVDKFGTAPAIFESVVADHLTSISGVKWKRRSSTGSAGKTEANKMTTLSPPPLPTSPLKVKLTKIHEGKLPVYAAMEPMVLYKSLNVNFPFCDLVYKENGKEGKLVCIQVTLEANGKREVKAGAFQKFCARMGWGEHPSKEQVDRISYVYCPDPAVADKAKVTFEAGVGIDKYTVWYVNTDYSSGT